ncbi:helicase [Qipengyuania sp. S6317L1]|uniref:helicase-related protein n=1 Tax=Qipengyuania sp. S6317L1 TaxID=2926410 RepID=UPI001FF3B0AD|nr:helicase-related protein [Qipengyuania sp. S6317L1]MCK0099082.1 helicase [Qipengyuania sp. S6317L1]
MCAHSSGMMGFPLRLLAREVYDRVRTIKGDDAVALITGEQRIEPPGARYFCCTMEAMDRLGMGKNGPHAFVAIDEAQIGADPERGHIFTDRLLHARGREETMILGSATLEPIVKKLIPGAEMVERPRFSTLSHAGECKLSRLPPRSAVVAFSTEQVYAMAEALRRFRGGAAVVMGALSPETRNKQVELFQNGEVDYIVATDAIGMGLNLDLHHVAFAALTKFDGRRKRRLTPSEMAQIAGRAGRHQTDGSFGVLTGGGSRSGAPLEFSEEEIYAIEEHKFAPLTKLFWREAEPRFATLDVLIGDLEAKPQGDVLKAAPEAIDLAVLKRLASEPIADTVKGHGSVRRFWEACSLPDFRQLGVDPHSRFVARLWQDLREGYLGADFVAARIAELDRTGGDIDTLQGRIAAIRSWAYICQRPDWVLARDEMAARARGVEARLSDALHARLTERFVNRRTAILMKSLGQDGASLPVTLEPDGRVSVEGETIGRLDGFRFTVDPQAGLGERKMLLSAGEKALPGILSQRAEQLLAAGLDDLEIKAGTIQWQDMVIAEIAIPDDFGTPRLTFPREISAVPDSAREKLEAGLLAWLQDKLAPLEPLRKLSEAATDPNAGSQARALLVTLIDARGVVAREKAGLEHLPKEMRPFLRKLGVTFGALDIFARDLLKPAPRQLLHALGLDERPLQEAMLPVLSDTKQVPAGYRMAGNQVIRVDLAEKILRAAFDTRAKAGEAPAAPAAPEAVSDAAPKDAAPKDETPKDETPKTEVAKTEAPEAENGKEPAAPEANKETASEQADTPKQTRPQPPKKSASPRNARFALDLALPVSIGLEEENARRLLGSAGFRVQRPKPLAEGAHGPLQPDSWSWRPKRVGERNNRRDDRRDNRKGAQGKGNSQGKRPGKSGKPQHGKGGKPKGQNAKRGGNNRNQRQNEPDFGPARAGGAFDKLADLLKP